MITLADIAEARRRYDAIGIDRSEPKDAPLHQLAAMGWPVKVALRAIEKFSRKGLLTWGVSPAYPFLTAEGLVALAASPPHATPAPGAIVERGAVSGGEAC